MRVLVICQGRSHPKDMEVVFGWGQVFLAPSLLLRWTSCHGAPGHSQSRPAVGPPSRRAACSSCQQLCSQHTGLLHHSFPPLPLCSHCPHVKGQRCQLLASSVLFCPWVIGPGKDHEKLDHQCCLSLARSPGPPSKVYTSFS